MDYEVALNGAVTVALSHSNLKTLWTIVVVTGTLCSPAQAQMYELKFTPYEAKLRSVRVLPDLEKGWIVHPSQNFCRNFIVPNWLSPARPSREIPDPLYAMKNRIGFIEPRHTSPAPHQYGDFGVLWSSAVKVNRPAGMFIRHSSEHHLQEPLSLHTIAGDAQHERFVPAMLLNGEKLRAPDMVLDNIKTKQFLNDLNIRNGGD